MQFSESGFSLPYSERCDGRSASLDRSDLTVERLDDSSVAMEILHSKVIREVADEKRHLRLRGVVIEGGPVFC